jgi:hypothetical protein
MDKAHKPRDSECDTASSEPFRSYQIFVSFEMFKLDMF